MRKSQVAVVEEQPAHLFPRAAYIHVPFCAHKCGYCDFASVAGEDARRDIFLRALAAEIDAVLPGPRSVRTLFVGGGTPTYLTALQLRTLLELLNTWFDPHALDEFTVESNPNTLDAEKVRILADHGVNRVSLGAQSFHPHLLQQLERNHDPASVPRAVDMVRQRIQNVSLDLIFGIPTQTFSDWESDLEKALALMPDHCSTYGLTYEKGTLLWKQRQQGQVAPVSEELEGLMYEHALDRLPSAGWEQYEVSNFARPGHACQHNLVYWANEAYYGFGPGAAAYAEGTRTLNTRELGAYLDRCLSGRSPISQSETLEPEARARETLILALRRRQGVHELDFAAQTGFSLEDLVAEPLHQLIKLELLVREHDTVRLTRAGLMVADAVMQALL